MSETTHDDGGIKVSSITVDASNGIHPPGKIVSMAEAHAGVYHLIADEYETTGNPRMVLRSTIGISDVDIPDGWEFNHAKPAGDGDVDVILTQTRD